MIREFLNLLRKDNLLVQAVRECEEMLDLCHAMVTASVESLRHRDDAAIDIDVYGMDKRLNAFERDVRRKVMTHLSLGNTADISSGLVLVSIVVDIERIGDYSKNIYDLARHHPSRLHAGELEEELAAIEREALTNFDRTVRAFKESDRSEASSLMQGYKADISSRCKDIEAKLVAGKIALSPGDAVAVALYVRFLKRISAHSRNLISSLVNPFHRLGYREKPKTS